MSSKLSYLSKYGGPPSSNDYDNDNFDNDINRKKSSKKKDKKSKKSHKKQIIQSSSSMNDKLGCSTLRDMDDIHSFIKGDKDVDAYMGEDDAPMVVDDVVPQMGVGGGRRGVFETVPINGDYNNSNGAKESTNGRGAGGRKQRHDSDSEDDNSNDNISHSKTRRRQRHDSSDDSSRDDNGTSKGYAKRRRERHDSSDSDNIHNGNSSARRGRRRHDSDDSYDGESIDKKRKEVGKRRHGERKRARHDSDSNEGSSVDDSGDRKRRKSHHRRRHDSSDDDDETNKAQKMSSGHKSGLQTSSDFATAERKLRKRQKEELAKHNAGSSTGETIYRDASGKKRTVSAQHDEEQLRLQEEEKEMKQRQANKGTYQKLQEEAKLRELEMASEMTLARTIDDTQLENQKKSIIRDGDPMAMYAYKKQQEEQSKRVSSTGGGAAGNAVQLKPMYKGPQPKPNRYGIRPGYRWDGIDRGNGFEDKVLEMTHSKGRMKEEAYKWSSADM